MHTILDSDDQEDIEYKDNYSEALIKHRDVHILHDKMEDLNKLDKEKLKDMKQNYDPKSEKIFKSTWDLSDSNEDETIVKNLYEDLSNLNIQENSDSSSNNTIIEAEKTEEIPDNVASCPPIPGGQVYNIDHPQWMESALKLNSSTGTEESSTPPQTSSRNPKYEYRTQVIHEKDCTCP